jgi:hypothetical protein
MIPDPRLGETGASFCPCVDDDDDDKVGLEVGTDDVGGSEVGTDGVGFDVGLAVAGVGATVGSGISGATVGTPDNGTSQYWPV